MKNVNFNSMKIKSIDKKELSVVDNLLQTLSHYRRYKNNNKKIYNILNILIVHGVYYALPGIVQAIANDDTHSAHAQSICMW